MSILAVLAPAALRLFLFPEPKCPEPVSAVAVWGSVYTAGPLLSLRRQPGIRYGPGEPLDFWNLEIRPDGTAALSAEGTPLISDGNYSGVVPPELHDVVRTAVKWLREVPGSTAMCMAGDYFQVVDLFSGFHESVCSGYVATSDLAEAYQATELMIRDTSWVLVSTRNERHPRSADPANLPPLPVRSSHWASYE